MIDKQFLREIIDCAKRMDDKGLVNSYEGNISARHGGLIYITPTGKSKATLTEDMIAVIDSDGRQVAGDFKPTSELPMHLGTYGIRDDIGGVVHAHPPFLTAHALCGKPVETRAYPEMMGNFGCFEVAPYGRPGTDCILAGAIPILKRRDVVLLANHGVIAVGRTVTDAGNRIEAAEAIAKTLVLTAFIGKQQDLSPEECAFFLSLSARD